MKPTLLALTFVIAGGAGCGGSPKPATAKAPTCADAAARAQPLIAEAQAGRPGGEELAAKVRDLIAERCPADGWSAEMRACMTGATTHDELHACRGKLTSEQDAKLDQATTALGEERERMKDDDDDDDDEPAASSPAPPPSDPCGGGE